MAQDFASVEMIGEGKTYSGFMVGPDGVNVRCNLTPGVHLLPVEKVEQLCRDFPSMFKRVEGESPHPPVPESPELSSPAAPASSTGSSTQKESGKKKGKR